MGSIMWEATEDEIEIEAHEITAIFPETFKGPILNNGRNE